MKTLPTPVEKTPPVPKLAGVDEDTQTSAQESVPVRYVAGEASVAFEWATPIYNQRAAEAEEGGGKK